MANWIVTEIELTGDRHTLEIIAKAINDCNDAPERQDYSEKNWVCHILSALRINTTKWNDRAFWSHAHFNKYGHLVFEETCAWRRSDCVKALKQKFPKEISGINFKSVN